MGPVFRGMIQSGFVTVNTEERSEWSLGSVLMDKNINPTRHNLSLWAPNTFVHQKAKKSSSPAFANLWLLLVLLTSLPVLVALKILRDILSFTRSFMTNTHPLVGRLENSDRKVKQFRDTPRITSISRLVYSLFLFTVRRYIVNVFGSAT